MQTYVETDGKKLVEQYIFEIGQYRKAPYIAKHCGFVGHQFWAVRDSLVSRLPGGEFELRCFDVNYLNYVKANMAVRSLLKPMVIQLYSDLKARVV